MRTTLEETKDDLIDRAASLAASRKGAGAPPGEGAARLLRSFYRHVAAEDIAERSEVDLYGAAMSQYKLAANRPQGTANIRVFTPTVSEHGWAAGGPHRRRGGHRRHAVPRRLGDDGAQRAEP